jgi:hypothetical protein
LTAGRLPGAQLPFTRAFGADLEIGFPRRGFYHKPAGVHFQQPESRRV